MVVSQMLLAVSSTCSWLTTQKDLPQVLLLLLPASRRTWNEVGGIIIIMFLMLRWPAGPTFILSTSRGIRTA